MEHLDLVYREVAPYSLQEKATITFTSHIFSNSETTSPFEGWAVEAQSPESGLGL